jgi:hypothetical protein
LTYISFSEKDRARWGLDEWLEFHPADISIADLGELADLCGFDYTEWPEPFWGDIPLERAGNPDAERVAPKWRLQALAWMTMRQNGVKVSWDEAGTVQSGWIRWRDEKPDATTPGKDESRGRRSRTSAASTTSRSSTSGRASRRTPSTT